MHNNILNFYLASRGIEQEYIDFVWQKYVIYAKAQVLHKEYIEDGKIIQLTLQNILPSTIYGIAMRHRHCRVVSYERKGWDLLWRP